MSRLVDAVARPEIAALTPYAARGGVVQNVIILDANENPWAPPGANGPWNRYPAQQPAALCRRLAALYGVQPDQLLVSRGADEGIDLLFRATCRAGVDAALITPPTFGLYKTAAAIQGAAVIEVPLDDAFNIQTDAIISAAKSNPVKLIFLCSPSNPTGKQIAPEDVLRIAQACTDQLVVIDEAYVEFADTTSLSHALADVSNLVVLRTLSKAYALAGARLGAVLANDDVIALLRKVLPPYPLPAPVIAEVERALSPVNMALFDVRIAQIKSERERVFAALGGSKYVQQVWPSSANFVLVKLKADSDIAVRLKARALHVRDFSALAPNLVRISIGAPEENTVLLRAFDVGPAIKLADRSATVSRQTKETQISTLVNLDAVEPVQIDTGIGFFDHMLEQIARHGGFSLVLNAKGDLHIDEHHTVEDCAIVLGQALREALGERAGIGRYGFVLPMDEAQARVAIDLSGRPALRFDADIQPTGAGGLGGQMVPHVFESLSQHLGAAIHIEAKGDNTHHIIEGIFKAFGRALRPAVARQGDVIPSSKGVL